MADPWLKGLRSDSSTGSTRLRTPSASVKLQGRDEHTPESLPSARGDGRTNKLAPRLPPGSKALGPSATKAPPAINTTPLTVLKTPRMARLQSAADSPQLDPLLSGPLDSPRAMSVASDLGTMDDVEGESVQVFVRVRPHNEEELKHASDASCVQMVGTRSVTCTAPGRHMHSYTYDQVLWQARQDEVFEVAGIPIVDNCMAGYNSSIFAYGQTGAGKTFTMLGQIAPSGEAPSEMRGLAPRVFEYLFQKIAEEEDQQHSIGWSSSSAQDQDQGGPESLRYSCKCSFLEIYNETITDLLNPSAHNLQIREDQRGCFVEGLSETAILNAEDALALMRRGAENRHVGETRLNRESSRSHSVFTCIVEKSSRATNGVTSVICSRLNLIDLAGSERIASGAMGGSRVQGEHFKEAIHINKSLTTLGRVIMELVDAQRKGRVGRHIPYRDSRLTFLLQDSLGGNAKTMIIANVSPSMVCANETQSTLQFVQRAKCIRNKATINLDYRGDVKMLQNEIVRLNTELDNLRKGFTDPAIQENKELRRQLEDKEKAMVDMEAKMREAMRNAKQFEREANRLEKHVAKLQVNNSGLEEYATKLASGLDSLGSASAHQLKQQQQLAGVLERQVELLGIELAASKAVAKDLDAVLGELRMAHTEQGAQLGQVQAVLASEQQVREHVVAELASMQHTLAELQDANTGLKEANAGLAEAKAGLEDSNATLEKAKAGLEEVHAELEQSNASLIQAKAGLEEANAGLEQANASLIQAKSELEGAKSELESQLAALKSQLADEGTARARAEAEVTSSKVLIEDLRTQLAEQAAGHAQVKQGMTASLEASQAQVHEITGKVHQLEEAMGVERSAHSATRAALDAQCALTADAGSELLSLKATAATEKAQLEADLAGKQQEAESLAAQVASLEGARVVVDVRVQSLEAELEQLRTQLAQALTDSSATSSEVSQLRTQMTEREAVHAAEVGQLNLAANEAGAQFAAHKAAAQAAQSELEGQLAGLRADKSSLVERVAAQESELSSQKARVVSLEAELAGSKEEVSQLREQLQGSKSSKAALDSSLSSVQGELAATKAALASSRESLAQEQRGAAELRTALAAKDEQVHELQRTVHEVEVQSAAMTREQQAQIATLQQDLIKSQEDFVSREFELKSEVGHLGAQLDSLRKEHASQTSRLEERTNELAAVKQSLAAQQDALAQAQQIIAKRERDLSEQKAKNEEYHQRHTQDAAAIKELQQELNTFKHKGGDMEQQMKTYLVANTRQNRAFTEIRRLIEWATTPPSSARTSVGARGETVPDASSPGPIPSEGAVSATLNSEAVSGISGPNPQQQAKNAHAIASMYRLRSSLASLSALAEEGEVQGAGSAHASPKGAQRPAYHLARTLATGSSGTGLSPRTRLSLTMAAAKESIASVLRESVAEAGMEGTGDTDDWRLPEPECDDDLSSPAAVRSSRDQHGLAELLASAAAGAVGAQ